jgi:hypothetical protein
MESKKHELSIMKVLLFSLMMVGVGLLSGCTSSPPAVETGPLLSSMDETILNTASNNYHVLLQTASAPQARAQIVEQLNTQYPGEVESAELGFDNYTIFVQYSDGGFAFVDTYDPNESYMQSPGTGYSAMSGSSGDNTKRSYSISFDGPHASSSPQVSFEGSSGRTTPLSKKVLVLAPCYYEFRSTQKYWNIAINMLRDHGWTSENMDVKLVEEDAFGDISFGRITPEDYYNWGQYGIVLFSGHGLAWRNHEENNLFIQFCFFNNRTIRENPALMEQLRQWERENKMIFGSQEYNSYDPVTDSHWFPSAIRLDLLRELYVGSLPYSFVYFATCWGGWFHRFYRDKGAAIVEGYDWSIGADVADANMGAMIARLIENGSSVYQAFLDDAVIKRTYFNGHYVNLKVYPDPMDDSLASRYYFPAWFKSINVTGIPSSAVSMNVTLTSGAGALMKAKNYPVDASKMSLTDLGDVLFIAKGTPTIQVIAFDSSGLEVASKNVTGVVRAGANTARLPLAGEEDVTHVAYTYEGHYNITIDLQLSSNKWEDGAEVAATATCSCVPVGNASPYDVSGFDFQLKGGSGSVVSFSPPFPGSDYGLIENGTQPHVSWGSPNGYGSSVTFIATFRLNQKTSEHPYIEARFSLWDTSANFAKIYLR